MAENYLGNPRLKSVGQDVEWTEESVMEYQKCWKDPEHFIENYVKIVHVDRGLVDFEMYPYQKKMIHTFQSDRFVICKMPRQTGKSTTIISFLLHYILFNQDVNCAVLANKLSTARELLGRLRLAYENLPKWMQQGIITWNKGDIALENGSKILAAATSSSAVRGSSFNIIFLDEFAHVPNTIADQFFTSVYPTISSGETTKVFIVSTPLGLNMFYKMWIDAEEGRSNYTPVEVDWREVPGRDDKWMTETIKNTSQQQFTQEFECEFIGSTLTLIAPSKLRTMTFQTPLATQGGMDVYEQPQKDRTYCIVADTAQGKAQDYSALSVFDITEIPYRQVAKYRDNKISPMLYPNVVYNIGMRYNTAWTLIEVNDVGQQVAEALHFELEYENILMCSMHGRAGQKVGGGFGKNNQLGIRTSKQLKRIGCAALKEMLETDKLIVPDFETIAELTTFSSKHNSFEAEEGHHDDLAMTLVIFCWLVQQQYFKDMTDLDIRKQMYKDQMEALEQDMLPFGIIDSGFEDTTFTDDSGQLWQVADEEHQRSYF